jgi:peptide-methionine (R)-S-oxide reductase
MNRRHFLLGSGAALAAGAGIASAQLRRTGTEAPPTVRELQQHWRDLLAPGARIAGDATLITRTDAEWRSLLSPLAYDVLRHEGTERPWSSPLDAEKRAGVFACAGCSLALFSSAMKFDSGTGWPSFFTTIPGVFATKVDTRLIVPRTEYHCVKCGGHQGHVFDDGPQPTGLRYCNDGVALRFIPARI